MTVDPGIAFVRELIEVNWQSAEGLSAMAGKVAPGFVHHAFAADTDFGGFRRGIEALRSGFPDLRYTVHHVFGDGEKYAALVTVTGTHLGQLGPLAPTGKVVTTKGAYHCRLDGGLLAEDWDLWAALPVPRQLSMLLGTQPA